MQEDIKILDILAVLRKHIRIILLSTFVGLILSTVFIFFVATPQYESKVQLLVGYEDQSRENEEINNPLQRNVSLINTYRDIIMGTSVLSEAETLLDNRYSLKQIRDAISIEHSQNSQAFSIAATMESPQAAQEVLNALTEAFTRRIARIYGDDNSLIYAISEASYNPKKVSPNEVFIILIGLMFGVSIGILIAYGLELSDSSVTEEEFFAQLGFIQLGKVYEISNEEANYREIISQTSDQSADN